DAARPSSAFVCARAYPYAPTWSARRVSIVIKTTLRAVGFDAGPPEVHATAMANGRMHANVSHKPLGDFIRQKPWRERITPGKAPMIVAKPGTITTSMTFPATRHSMVAAIRSEQGDVRRSAFDTLVTVYWKPVFKYVRLKWHASPDDAADLTQGFFLRAFEKEFFAGFDP